MSTWTFDPTHSQIQFSARHMGLSTVRGTFEQFSGTLVEANGIATEVQVEIDLASLTTGNAQRDGHLKGDDFFAIGLHPTAHFSLTKFTRDGSDVVAEGALTIRGVTKPVKLSGEIGGPGVDPWGNQRLSASLAGKISRKEWGLVWNVALEAGGMLVSDEIKLEIDVQALPMQEKAAA
jgi:polyisoprenoid-binding protein YceI